MPSSPDKQEDDDSQSSESSTNKEVFRSELTKMWVNVLVVLVLSIIASTVFYFTSTNRLEDVSESQSRALVELNNRLDSLRNEIRRQKSEADSIFYSPEEENVTYPSGMDSLKNEVRRITKKINNIESIVSDSPLDALQLPLLKDRISDLDQRISSQISSLERSIGNLRNLVWTLLAGFITLVGGLITVVLSNLL